MLDFGQELKAAREAKGLTISNIAQTTHMMSSMIEDLENENFSRIVAPIYGRGFVKLYCEAVGLDPKPFVAEFMDIYNGNRDPAIRERPAAAPTVVAPEPPPSPAPTPVAAPEPAPEPEPERAPEPDPAPEPAPVLEPKSTPQPTLFDPPSAWRPPEPARTRPETERERLAPAPLQQSKPLPSASLSRYASPFKDHLSDIQNLMPTILRWALLAVVALLVLWGVIAGISALYRATNTPGETNTPSETSDSSLSGAPAPAGDSNPTSEPRKPSDASQPPPPRTPLAIPPLYID